MIERDKSLRVRANSKEAAAQFFLENYGIDAEPVPCGQGCWQVPSQIVLDSAMSIFTKWAEDNNRNYFSDIVQEELEKYLKKGYSPQDAVDALVARAPK